MKKSKKIKYCARIGEIAFFLYNFFNTVWEMQYIPFESAGTKAQILSCICLGFMIIFCEAIVRLIVYFAEILKERK